MNQTLNKAIREAEALPEAEQEELGQALMKMAVRKKIDAMLAQAEARGGSIPHDEVVARMRAYCDERLTLAVRRGGSTSQDEFFSELRTRYEAKSET
jgi:hypothetical protein